MRIRPLFLLLPLLGACATESSDDAGTDVERGGLGKADLVGSCEHPNPNKDLCGGRGIGNCWCDDACVDFGDCCSDVESVCGIEPEPSEGTPCGGFLGDTCAEDEYCVIKSGFGLEVAKTANVSAEQIVVHDATLADSSYAFALSRLSEQDLSHFPMGIFRKIKISQQPHQGGKNVSGIPAVDAIQQL